ncbi:uncharacterized protein LOC132735325 isoform X2 [Ruditapes philippinarum]|uniref:uncharacterized protein LOC132735325 isoform X2 n=1 Tax=Ruditapes philippinarum TaxID=129788 RepID=UPI00295AB235|nr:uncharacterized protein LOC132735325 isoform X2 [Ruditapes philippinarum]
MPSSRILQLLQFAGFISATTECTFPEYIQSPIDESGSPMPWTTQVSLLNLRHEPKVRQMQEVFVHGSLIWSQSTKNRWPCDRKSRHVHYRATSGIQGSCSEKTNLHNRTCLTEERFDHFKVIEYGSEGGPYFLCVKFIQRSTNVVQIMEGKKSKFNDKNLCDERQLQLKEWPWIAPWRRQVITCPINGGFSFRTLNKLTNEDFCEEEWRKSRLEIDCAKGDGLNFIAPKGSQCNPFSSKSEVSRFYCWAGWQELYYTFLVVGDANGEPQFCLRFPREITQSFQVMVYFSVICPLQEDGMPPTGIEYHELEMNTIAPDKCVDDNTERCHMVEKKGQCKKEEKYAVHCQRSCKKCTENSDTFDMLCPFASRVQGTWLFYDTVHKEEVKINDTAIRFSQFGTFICKEKSVFSDRLYKTVTVFNNGCSMRYTCFELDRRNNNILQFRVGKSYRTDIGFDSLCHFEDHKSPVHDPYRSSNMKNLILDGHLRDEYCGFSHTIPFNGTVYGEACTGTISDWDSDGCVTRGVLNLRSHTCRNLAAPMELQCLGFLKDHPLEQYLITRSMISGNYNCWVLTSFLCSHWKWNYRALVKLDSPQCFTLADSTCALDSTPAVLLYLQDEDQSRFCKGTIGDRTTAAPLHPRQYNHSNDQPPYHNPNTDIVYQNPLYVESFESTANSITFNSNSLIKYITSENIFSALVYIVTLMWRSCVLPT